MNQTITPSSTIGGYVEQSGASLRKIRLVHYNHTGAVAGAECALLNVLPWLRSLGFESIVLSPAGGLQRKVGQIGTPHELCYALSARFTWNPLRCIVYLWSVWLAARSLRRQLATICPDVIHANSVRAGIAATLATVGLRTPVVWHVHDALPRHPISIGIQMLAALSWKTGLVTVSRATEHSFTGRLFRPWLRAKSDLLYNVSCRPHSSSTTLNRARIRSELAVDKQFVVGCVGQICARKNQIAFIDVFKQALELSPHMVLIIVGGALFPHDKPYETKLRDKVNELGMHKNVLLLGIRDDVSLLLNAFDILVLPSLSEGFPMIVLEAMVAKLPVLAFAVDGVQELITHDQTGWLVAPGDRDQMIRSLVRAESNRDECIKLGCAARRVVENNSEEEYALRFAQIMRKNFYRNAKHFGLKEPNVIDEIREAAQPQS